jgi:N-acyl homoserine lactone hydrolase
VSYQAGTAQRLWALDSPSFVTRRGNLAVGVSNPEGLERIPAPSYLIQHARGLIVFDTGLAPEAASDPDPFYGPFLREVAKLEYAESQRLDRQIEALGFALSDVTHVIASHLHLDHIGGLHLFPDAQLLVGRGELGYACWPDPAHAGLYQRDRLDALRARRWREVDGDLDLFGDGGIVLLDTPGHSPGELSLLIRLPGQNIILSGDTVHLRDGYEQALNYCLDYDSLAARRSMRRLQSLSSSLEAQVWIGHDPGDWAATKLAPYVYE